jgi:uncharacterized protein YbjT (DUF2867 family)
MPLSVTSILCVPDSAHAEVMNILVTGGTGKTGSRVSQLLVAAGHPVRVATRNSTPRFDWHDQTTWDQVLEGCAAAYLTFQPDLGLPGADGVVAAFARRAVDLGCRRLVLLSGRGEVGARRAEAALVASGARATVLRSAFFMQNFTESFFAEEIAHGSLTMIEGAAAEPFVDADDLAEAAVRTLLDPAYVGRVLELTGPALLTFEQVAREIASVVGGTISYRGLPVDDYAAELVGAGLPEGDAIGMAHLFREVLDGRNAHVDGDLEAVLGRTPRAFGTFLAAAMATDGDRRG